jgi:hypothetical protein
LTVCENRSKKCLLRVVQKLFCDVIYETVRHKAEGMCPELCKQKFEKILSIGWVVLSDVENFEKICVSKNTRFVVVVSKSDWNLKIYLRWIGQICFVHSENYVWDAIFWKKFENRFKTDLENVSNMWRQILQKNVCDFRCSKNFNSCWKSVVHK